MNYTSVSAQTQYSIYASLLFHFAKYTQFPASNNVLTVGIMSNSQLLHEAMALNGRSVGTSTLQVKEISDVSEISKCNIIFVPSKLSSRFSEILSAAKESHTLIISDCPNACKGGVVINFFEEGSKVRFEISNKNAAACGLKISNDLQKLAKIVD
jgi:histidinol-phosphate/aromatic aminotransferase/cobyric acid decarboxylase-like protein